MAALLSLESVRVVPIGRGRHAQRRDVEHLGRLAARGQECDSCLPCSNGWFPKVPSNS